MTTYFMRALTWGLIAFHAALHAPPICAPIRAAPVVERFPCVATYYSAAYHGRLVAGGHGERYDMHAFTAAHPTLPFGTLVRVRWFDRAVIVRINDRPGHSIGLLDLSQAAYLALAPLRTGRIHVIVEVIP